MKWEINSFRGILLQMEDENIAVNSGGSIEEMEKAYIGNGKVPYAMILTSEHYQCSYNVIEFCKKHNVSLITADLCAQRLAIRDAKNVLLTLPTSKIIIKLGCRIVFFPIKYDSIDPFFLTVQEGGVLLGIVPDGKILPDFAKYLLECDKVILGNRLRIPEKTTPALERRLRGAYNTQEELDEIFKNYEGEIIYI